MRSVVWVVGQQIPMSLMQRSSGQFKSPTVLLPVLGCEQSSQDAFNCYSLKAATKNNTNIVIVKYEKCLAVLGLGWVRCSAAHSSCEVHATKHDCGKNTAGLTVVICPCHRLEERERRCRLFNVWHVSFIPIKNDNRLIISCTASHITALLIVNTSLLASPSLPFHHLSNLD